MKVVDLRPRMLVSGPVGELNGEVVTTRSHRGLTEVVVKACAGYGPYETVTFWRDADEQVAVI
jgi:hypothetical protein